MNKLVIRSTDIENSVLTAYKMRSDFNSRLTFFFGSLRKPNYQFKIANCP